MRRERHQDVLPAGAGRVHERGHLRLLPGALPVPGHEVAHVPEFQRLPGRADEHLRLLLADPHAVPSLGSRREEPGDQQTDYQDVAKSTDQFDLLNNRD
jgi:hypothetical protein